MTRQAYRLEAQKVMVFWSPKVACTSIANAIGQSVFGVDPTSLKGSGRGMRGWLGDTGVQMPGEEAAQLCRDGGYTSIALLRDPYDRLVSAYLNKFAKYHATVIDHPSKMESFARSFYETEILPRQQEAGMVTDPYPGLTFRDFVTAVCARIETRGKAEPVLDHHWNTQVPYSFLRMNFSYDHVYTLEQTDAFFARLSALTGIAIENRRVNASRRHGIYDDDLVDASSLEVGATGVVAKEQFRSKVLAKRVRQAFKIDYNHMKLAQSQQGMSETGPALAMARRRA
jgi:hypothetical protein